MKKHRKIYSVVANIIKTSKTICSPQLKPNSRNTISPVSNMFILLGVLIIATTITGCSDFLSQKADGRLAVPTKVVDFQAMLDNFGTVNNNFVSAGEVSADDFYLRDADLRGLSYESDRRLYTWQADFVARPQSTAGDEWYNCYTAVNICNLVLKGLDDNNLSGVEVDMVRAHALFMRAVRFLDAVQTWCVAYMPATADRDLGIVLKVNPDPDERSVRASLAASYAQIITDLESAYALLPERQPGKTAPTRLVAAAMLARVYLYMGDYAQADRYLQTIANSELPLLDFNVLNPATLYPIPTVTDSSIELLFWSNAMLAAPLNGNIARIAPELIEQYEPGDLRRQIYFRQHADGTYFFRGSHVGQMTLTPGMSSSEVLLMKAECYAHLNNLPASQQELNHLLVTRYESGKFQPYNFSSSADALEVIRTERRKELVMRGLRWADIKRYNRDGAGLVLERDVQGELYRLQPGDPRYAIAIPEEVIALSGIQQNSR